MKGKEMRRKKLTGRRREESSIQIFISRIRTYIFFKGGRKRKSLLKEQDKERLNEEMNAESPD